MKKDSKAKKILKKIADFWRCDINEDLIRQRHQDFYESEINWRRGL